MNVYDFDGTVYAGDSSVDFYLYCLRKHPAIAAFVFRQGWGVLQHATGRIDTMRMKQEFFCFLRDLKESETLVETFWNGRQAKIRDWYLERKQADDVIISASPEFLLLPVCRRLGLQPPIATQMDPASGKIKGQNCKGTEKVRRFRERFPEERVGEFFSDSLTDAPLAALAERAFFIKRGAPGPWPR